HELVEGLDQAERLAQEGAIRVGDRLLVERLRVHVGRLQIADAAAGANEAGAQRADNGGLAGERLAGNDEKGGHSSSSWGFDPAPADEPAANACAGEIDCELYHSVLLQWAPPERPCRPLFR